MGISPLRSCFTNDSAPAPNPSPSRWTLIEKFQFPNAHILKVKYHGCDNFEGVKIMLYKGDYQSREILDPHFDNTENSPIARFKPTEEGLGLAIELAVSL